MGRLTEDLTNRIAEFPGIGPRQARRIVQSLLAAGKASRERLAKLIVEAGASATQCASCFRFDDKNAGELCRICRDQSRDRKSLMIIEKEMDIESVESAGAYHGLYFVLGGLRTLTERKSGPTVRSKELFERIKKNGIEEVIFALSTTAEGDYTARELSKEIQDLNPNVKATLLGRGLSIGAEIEYADAETIRSALKNRG